MSLVLLDGLIVEGRGNRLSSMYQLQGNSTSVFCVAGAGAGRGFIQDEADRWGEKSTLGIGGA